jgi:hypothetical protein
MKKALIFFVIITFFCGCSSIKTERQRFIYFHDYYVGRPFKDYFLTKPFEQIVKGDCKIEYWFRNDACVWWITVENGLTIAWGVDGDLKDCRIESNF